MIDPPSPSVGEFDAPFNDSAWTGCDWPTEFGPLRLNLCEIRSRQARTAASATRGPESQQWLEAAQWLESVEKDAEAHRQLLNQDNRARQRGKTVEVERLQKSAAEIEAKYPQHFRRPVLG